MYVLQCRKSYNVGDVIVKATTNASRESMAAQPIMILREATMGEWKESVMANGGHVSDWDVLETGFYYEICTD